MSTPDRFGAILLAGGRAARLDGVDKPLIEIGGVSLLRRAVSAVDGADPLTIVGPRRPGRSVPATVRPPTWIREDPPFGGPAAAVVAALATWDDDPEHTVLLACDLADPHAAVALLHAETGAIDDGVCLADAQGRPQWLTGLYRTEALRRGAQRLADGGANASLRSLLSGSRIRTVAAPLGATDDIDTWDDVQRHGAHVPDITKEPS